ncbi:MAG: hypothetical protein GC205_01130 [Bacteroidetes bacterium]|nr:hypothetical protein [Bacteroidota bacterium]
MGRKLRTLLVAILSSAVTATAQLETANWYFGQYAGVDHSAATPSVVTDGLTNTIEGTASISDGWGNLLFYTDGRTIWDRNHNAMPTGTGLAGGPSAAQSAMIIRQPLTDNIYFVFTAYHMGGSPGLSYSIVDMLANGGLGDVIVKDVPLSDPVAEKITAYKHSNNQDIWIVTHGFGNDEFQARLLTPTGLDAPVLSNVGSVHGMIVENSIGFMKFSPDGNWLAAAIFKQSKAELFRFDRSTGMVSEPLTLLQDGWTYGLEFSPNSSKLYLTTHVTDPALVQYDLSSNDYAVIPTTRDVVAVPSVSQPGGLALAPNGKIYMANWTNFLSVINQPDVAGSACGYVNNAINLGAGVAKLSSPNFPPYLFAPNWLESSGICLADTTHFTVYDLAETDSVRWNFGDPASGAENTMTAMAGYHVYSSPGTYTATAVLHGWGPPDTLTFDVTIHTVPYVNLGVDTSLCPGMLSLDIYPELSGVTTVTWHDGSTVPVYSATEPGLVWAMASNACATACDSLMVVSSSLAVNLGDDQKICRQEGVTLSTGMTGMDHAWSTGQTTEEITVLLAGIYTVLVTDPFSGCIGYDTVVIDVVEVTIPLPATALLHGGSLVLDAGNPGSLYLWSTGETTQTITVTTPGSYTVSVQDPNGCTAAATILVSGASGLDVAWAGSLQVGPVPTTGNLHVYWQGTELLDSWAQVLGADGRLVWMGRLIMTQGSHHELPTSNLAAGTYVLRVETEQGEGVSKTFLKIDF